MDSHGWVNSRARLWGGESAKQKGTENEAWRLSLTLSQRVGSERGVELGEAGSKEGFVPGGWVGGAHSRRLSKRRPGVWL